MAASGMWRQAGRPAGEQRRIVLVTLGNMALGGHIRKGEGTVGYRTRPPGYRAPPGVVPVIAGARPGPPSGSRS